APENGLYLISRISGDEKLVLILNKNEEPFKLDLQRFEELGLNGSEMKNLISQEKINWEGKLELPERGAYLYTTKLN
ncbi:MAG: cyclomaltodextrinase C-terminal domain-containing protein, partial [Christiangramia sp.]|nr:cyclomaltodextrinase C-terminal domain-containing protein [Christiangramia sp.]